MTTSRNDLLLPDLPEFQAGWVWLVGAGPGDPGLLTLHALHALRSADVIIYDALVDERILRLTGNMAELVYAGKRGGKPSPKQPDISNRIIKLAQAGKRVCRLKGGDPFVFGRGGEEALALVRAGIPFRLVPGVTAGIGGLAYAGIPATHRDTNSAITFVTGHSASGEVPDCIDWDSLAKGSPALVIYMAIKHAERIAAKLMAGGRSPDEPAAFVGSATTEHQRVVETTLGRAAIDVIEQSVTAPSIFVVGNIVRLRSALDWLGAIDGRVLNPDPLNEGYGRNNTETG